MSDFAEGLLVFRATRRAVLASLRAHRVTAFISPSGLPIRVYSSFSSSSSRPLAGTSSPDTLSKTLSASMDGSVVVYFSAGDDVGTLRAWSKGKRIAALQTPGRLSSSKLVTAANQFIAATSQALHHKGSLSDRALALNALIPQDPLFNLRVDYRLLEHDNYSTLFDARLDVSPHERQFLFLNANGKTEPFQLAPTFATQKRNRVRGRLGTATNASEWLSRARRIDPINAEESVLNELFGILADRSERKVSTQTIVVRESAAALLAKCVMAEGRRTRRAWLRRILSALSAANDFEVRGLYARALRGSHEEAGVESSLIAVMKVETSPSAARRIYETLVGITHEPKESELLALIQSPSLVHRKGAYALLEQSASPGVMDALRSIRQREKNRSAQALLRRVITTLEAEAG